MANTSNGAPRQTKTRARNTSKPIDYSAIHQAALAVFPSLLRMWLPNGRMMGREYVALNPRRDDRRPGSFRINTRTGKWADFATGDRGGDVVSLFAFLFDLPQREAAGQLAALLRLSDGRAS